MPTGPGPRQRRATKIANRSHVTPFDRLAQWNAEIMRLGSQGAVPSIVGNDLQFKKLNASDISGVMDNPATEDLDMNGFGIIRANRLEVDTNATGTPYINITGITSSTLTVNSTGGDALIEMDGFGSTILRGKSKLKIETDNDASSNNIEISPYGTLALQSLGVNGGGNGTIVIGNSSLALMDLTGDQISLDAGTPGLQMGSDGGVTIDAASNIEIDAAGRLDLSGNQIYIDSDGAGVNIAAVNAITLDAANNIEIEASGTLDLSGTTTHIKGNTVDIDATILDIDTTSIDLKAIANIDIDADATLTLGAPNISIDGTTELKMDAPDIVIGTSGTSQIDISGSDVAINAPTILIGTSGTSTVDISGQITLNNVVDLKATDITATGTIQGGSLTDGTAVMSSGDLNGIHDLSIDNSGSFIVNTNITGFDLINIDAANRTSTFNFNSSTASAYLILKDLSGSSTFIKQQGTTLLMENSDLQVGAVGLEKKVTAAEITGWFNTRDYFAVAKVVGVDGGGGMPQPLIMSLITNNCPGSIQLINPSATPYTNTIDPQATGVYTVTITGVWTGGNPWDSGSSQGQPMILMYGPAYHSSAPVNPAMLALQSSSRFYNSGYTNYQTFSWTGRMVHEYDPGSGVIQAKYSFSCKQNGGGGSGTITYTGQLQVTRIC